MQTLFQRNHVTPATSSLSDTTSGIKQEEEVDPRQVIDEAREVLRGGDLPSEELKNLYKKLESLDQFAYASEVLFKKISTERKEGNPVALKEYQTLAKFIYKDESLPSSFKFDRAMHELNANDELDKTTKCETLGLAGAISKYKWQYDHQFKNLLLSQHYYGRGYQLWKEHVAYSRELERIAAAAGPTLWNEPGANAKPGDNDDGYTAINYAYINELIAVDRMEETGRTIGIDDYICRQFEAVKNIRTYILDYFIADAHTAERKPRRNKFDRWIYGTIAEAYFGLRNYDAALDFINIYNGRSDVQDWEKRSFSRQLFSLAYLQIFQLNFVKKHQRNGHGKREESDNWKYLKEEVKNINTEKINSCLAAANSYRTGVGRKPAPAEEIKKDGRSGLALSGGGFRASLFHIGVLAALAEKDELRNIEVLSCVSGGSVVGAFYYLKLKELLESKPDEAITREDYIRIVKETEIEFLEGIQKNLRVRVFGNLGRNFKMLFSKNYSRTHRLGELYEKHLYSSLLKTKSPGEPIYMKDLFIQPKNDEQFSPKVDNWRRRNKVPQLVLNATSVNTGHNWQFTASWMGEPPGNIQADIDVKPRLRRMYYDEAPDEYRNFRLGYAVASSSCIPALFEPMPMHGLYENIDLHLIDGGLHDNQGIAALIEQECRNMIISDASGQLPTTKIAEKNNAGVFFRADNILQERLRESQLMDIKDRTYSAQLNKLMIVTLKNDLPSDPENWKYCKDPKRKILYSEIKDVDKDLTKYSIQRNVQTHLSEIRTDLDSFNDTEAYALMYSGYAQVKYEYTKKGWNADAAQEKNGQSGNGPFRFMQIRDFVTIPEKAALIEPLLITAKKTPFKVIDVSKPLRYSLAALGLIALCYCIYLCYVFFDSAISFNLPVQVLVFSALVVVIGFFSKILANLLDYKAFIRKYVLFFLLIFAAWMISNIHIFLLNNVYNNAGKIKAQA